MRKERTNIYLTSRQKKQLEQRSQAENLPIAELIRRALDAYLAWTIRPITPTPHPQTRNAAFIPRRRSAGAFRGGGR